MVEANWAVDYTALYGFLISLGVGALVGIERERRLQRKDERQVAGVRTFILIALLGTTAALVAEDNPYFSAVIVAGGILLIGAGYYLSSTRTNDIGLTTEVAQLLVFAFGYLAYDEGTRNVSVMLGIITAVLLALKEHLHEFAKDIQKYEFIDTLKFAVIAFIILPLLPDRTIDPWGVVNPHQLWLLVVLISGISYVGYILVKVLGVERGLGLTGFLGGLSSSTAVTTAMASKTSRNSSVVKPAAFAAVIASTVMFPRIVFEVAVVDRGLLAEVAVPVAVMFLAGLAAALLLWRSKKDIKADLDLKTPFALKPALKFGAFFLIVLLLQHFGKTYFGSGGLYAVSLVSGLADVDAITLSTARMASTGDINSQTAVNAIVLAAMANTVMKAVYAYVIGNRGFGNLVAAASAAMIVAGAATILLL